MSSPNSSSSSLTERRALRERSNSEKNKLAIRIVPYTPPRIASASNSHADSTAEGNGGAGDTPDRPAEQSSLSAARAGRKDFYASSPGSALSSAASSPTRAKGKGVSGTKLSSYPSGVGPSTPPTPARGRASYGSNYGSTSGSSSRTSRPQLRAHGEIPTSPSPSRTPRSRRDNYISVHADKTFTIVLKPTNFDTGRQSASSSLFSPPLSNHSVVSSSHERISFDAPTDDRPSSPATSIPDYSASPIPTPYTPYSAASDQFLLAAEDPISSSPNYRMVGGLRKVAKTPDLKEKGKEKETAVAEEEKPLPSVPGTPSLPEEAPQSLPSFPGLPEPAYLAAKPSFTSEFSVQSESTIDGNANYKILARSSPPLPDADDSILVPPSSSSSQSNYRLLGESSPAPAFGSSPAREVLETPGSKNFVVHGQPSLSSLSEEESISPSPRPQHSDDSLALRGKWSQDSLVVPPLRPRAQSSSEKFGYYKQRSRESLKHKYSFSSISSVISQDAASVFLAGTPNVIRLQPSTSSLNSTWAGPSNVVPQRPLMEAHPHQWSSQLSTVMSEDERSEVGSRARSSSSVAEFRSNIGSRGSRHMLSISSSLAEEEEGWSRSQSRSPDSLSPPGPAYMRGALPSLHVQQPSGHLQHFDEDGDGLAELENRHLSQKSSRSRLSNYLSHRSSDRDLRSSASSRAGSLTAASIPAWARVYYGSGERKWLAAPSIRSSIRSYDDSRPGSSWGPAGSPTSDQFGPNITTHHRRRPREVQTDMPMSPMSPDAFGTIRLGVRRMTSSIWSPHLRHDRRPSRYSLWQPPPTSWSQDTGMFGRRNVQIVLFALGFVFPFAWMIAAFLPLPPKPSMQMFENNQHSAAQFGIPENAEFEPSQPQVVPVDDIQFQSARWWRNVNRFMSVVGLLIIGAIIALVILSKNSRTSLGMGI